MSATPPPGQPAPPAQNPNTSPKKNRPELDEDARRFYSRFIGWLLLALIIAYGGLQMPLPWRLVTIVVSLGGAIGAAALLVQSIRRKLPPAVLIGSVILLVCCGFFLFTAGVQAIFWEASVQFDNCLRSAVTERATSRCFDQYEQDMIGSIPGMR
ncbi:hypothetical protein [Nesterenkonia muleiensis]|uniref:hypothetical protein n=1 Tax=Nesterenkonia muleiensis TaxID=2282648 RepID=UPI000E708BC9|nr:hypothetical protein [Nesterenkonia muleiensis]